MLINLATWQVCILHTRRLLMMTLMEMGNGVNVGIPKQLLLTRIQYVYKTLLSLIDCISKVMTSTLLILIYYLT